MGVGTIPKNETSGTFTVAVKDDTAIERDDTLLIELRDPKDGLILDATAVATIRRQGLTRPHSASAHGPGDT